MRILICGSRYWDNREMIKRYLLELPKDTIIIEGEASGADRIAREEAEKLGMTVEKYPAYWDKYGKSAGYIRNKEMLDLGNPDKVVAFWDGKSKGTKNMIKQAKEVGISPEVKKEGV